MSSRKIIFLLLIVLVGVAGYSFMAPRSRKLLPAANAPTPVPTSEPLTGTFVDTLRNRVVYYKDQGLYEIKLPSRTPTRLAGVDKDVVNTFPAVRPAWSPNGKLFVFVVNDSTIVMSEYATGLKVTQISLDPKIDLGKRIDISFSPDNLYILLKQKDNDHSHIRFFDAKTGKLITEQSNCTYQGTWLLRVAAYATSCLQEGRSQVVLIYPASSTSSIVPLGPSNTYTLLNIFDSSSLLVLKGEAPGKLSLTGQFTSLDPKQFKTVGDVRALADLSRTLADRIEKEKSTEKIDDLVVSPSGTFAIYHTHKGLWIINLPLSSDPYFLFEGSLPSIQPL